MFIADLHIHSRYSRATSRDLTPEHLDLWARRKGLDLIGTGDFTHPAWREELREKLVPAEEGLYTLAPALRLPDEGEGSARRPRFMITGEISSIYKKGGRVRKVHNLLLLPGIEEAEILSRRLEEIGNLHSDGRPILGLDSRDLLEITLECCPSAVFIPAHIWTPHFSLFGAFSGFDDIRECFEDLTPYVRALETGLSSDPPMNGRLSALDDYVLVSNSDAHSPSKLAREANLFDCALSYPAVARALSGREAGGFAGTLEFFPEEGKYHYDGHRHCKLCLSPAETIRANGVCPVCGGRLTVGVQHRVEALADRTEGEGPASPRLFERLVPLPEVIASSTGRTAGGKKVLLQYDELLRELGPELHILRETPLADIETAAGPCVAEGIRRLRAGEVELSPGYDGEYGTVRLLDQSDIDRLTGQLRFFSEAGPAPRVKESPAPKPSVPAETVAKVAAVPRDESADRHYGLNDAQWRAVSSSDPTVAVIAGPGSGKTRTLVYRIAYLVQQRGVRPEKITAVTFTNRAANEMRERLEALFGNKKTVRAMHIGTFHSLCLRQLDDPKRRVTVIDEFDARSVVADIAAARKVGVPARDLLREISRLKSGAAPDPALAGELPALLGEYDRQLALLGVIDFDDILLEGLRRAESGESGPPSGEGAHLLVDEFQDINDVQYRLIRAWATGSESLFVIGDPDQSIYGFRGSDSLCFDRLIRDLPGAAVVRLTVNYRSTPEILRCALPVISTGGAARRLDPAREHGPAVRLLNAEDPFAEALFVAKEINRLVGGMDMLDAAGAQSGAPRHGKRKNRTTAAPRGFSDIAVLYRTHRQAEPLELCLSKESIPYVVAGRDDSLGEETVRRAVSFFRFLLNPADAVSLRICLKAADLRPATRAALLDAYVGGKRTVAAFIDLVSQTLGTVEAPGLSRLRELLEAYLPRVGREAPASLVDGWITDNALGGDRPLERLRNTALLHSDVASFLQALTLGGESDLSRSGSRLYTPDAVTLLTLHGSKGLEFPVVFLCGASQGLIPLQNPGRETDFAEERRLFYVGMTRAQEELTVLSTPPASGFLNDIPAGAADVGPTAWGTPSRGGKQLSFFD